MNMPDGTQVEEVRRVDRVSLPDLVAKCSHKLTAPASTVWEMSIPDICLTLRHRDGEDEDDQTRGYELDWRREVWAKLTVAEKVRLEQLKADLM